MIKQCNYDLLTLKLATLYKYFEYFVHADELPQEPPQRGPAGCFALGRAVFSLRPIPWSLLQSALPCVWVSHSSRGLCFPDVHLPSRRLTGNAMCSEENVQLLPPNHTPDHMFFYFLKGQNSTKLNDL